MSCKLKNFSAVVLFLLTVSSFSFTSAKKLFEDYTSGKAEHRIIDTNLKKFGTLQSEICEMIGNSEVRSFFIDFGKDGKMIYKVKEFIKSQDPRDNLLISYNCSRVYREKIIYPKKRRRSRSKESLLVLMPCWKKSLSVSKTWEFDISD